MYGLLRLCLLDKGWIFVKSHRLVEDFNWFVWRLVKTNWSAFQFRPWLQCKAYKCLGWLYWADSECFMYKIINYPINSGTWIHRNSIHKWTHCGNLSCDSYELIKLNSYWIFHTEFNTINVEFRFDTMNSHWHIWIHILNILIQSLYKWIDTCEFIYSWTHTFISYMNTYILWIHSYDQIAGLSLPSGCTVTPNWTDVEPNKLYQARNLSAL